MRSPLLLCLVACHPLEVRPPSDPLDTSPPAPVDSADSPADFPADSPVDSVPYTDTDTDTGTGTGTDTGTETVPGADDGNDFLWGLDTVHTLDITVSETSYAALAATVPYTAGEYVPADIVLDGEAVPNVGIRLKGRWGSWRSIDAKAAFKIDINKFVPGRRFHGLEKLTLNNMVVDCTMNREEVAWYVMDALGIPAPRTGYIWVTLNGADYGLYLNVETVDDRFLERQFSDPEGNLYEADYIIWPDGSYTLADFQEGHEDVFTLQEGEDVALADIHAVTQAIGASGLEGFTDTVGALVDLDAQQRLVAAEVWLGHIDGYSLNQNNYYAWFDPAQGLMLLPWDLDYGFIDEADWGFSWAWPNGILSRTCLQDPDCASAARARLVETLDQVDLLDLQARMDEGVALVDPYLQADPRQECSRSYVQYYRRYLSSWFVSRRGHVEAEWGL